VSERDLRKAVLVTIEWQEQQRRWEELQRKALASAHCA
jgi:hypothetical protein